MTAEQNQKKRPDFNAYHVKKYGEGKSNWTQIGAAWKHADGSGINLMLDCVPIDGRVTLLIPSKKDGQKQGTS